MDNVPFDAVRRSLKPVVSAVNGLAQGGGLLIAMLSDVAVAVDTATFRAPSCTGALPTWGTPPTYPRRSDRPELGTCCSRAAWSPPSRRWSGPDLPRHRQGTAAGGGHRRPRVVLPLRSFGLHRSQAGDQRRLRHLRPHDHGQEHPRTEALEGWQSFRDRRNPTWVPDDLRLDGRL